MRRGLSLLCVLCVLSVVALRAESPDLKVTPLQRDGQVLVSFELTEGVTPDILDAIQSGLPTTFSYQIDLRQGSTLFDKTIASMTISASVRFDNLTRRYQMSRSIDGRVEDARPSEDQDAVRQWLTRFDRIPVSSTAALEPNGEYHLRVRALARPRSDWFAWVWDRNAVFGDAKFTFIP